MNTLRGLVEATAVALGLSTLAMLLASCTTASGPVAPGPLIEQLCGKYGPGLHTLDDHSRLWCGTPRART